MSLWLWILVALGGWVMLDLIEVGPLTTAQPVPGAPDSTGGFSAAAGEQVSPTRPKPARPPGLAAQHALNHARPRGSQSAGGAP